MGATNIIVSTNTGTNWDSVLEALGLMIVAGGRVFKERVDQFVAEAMYLKDHICPEYFMTEAMLQEWFVFNRSTLCQKCSDLAENGVDDIFVKELRYNMHFDEILKSMRRIAEVDPEGFSQSISLIKTISKSVSMRDMVAF